MKCFEVPLNIPKSLKYTKVPCDILTSPKIS